MEGDVASYVICDERASVMVFILSFVRHCITMSPGLITFYSSIA